MQLHAHAVAEHVIHCVNIEELRLEGYGIDDASIDTMIACFKQCRNLCELHLEDNCFSEEGENILMQGLSHVYTSHDLFIQPFSPFDTF